MGGSPSRSVPLADAILYSRVYSFQHARADVLQLGAHHPVFANDRDDDELHVDRRHVEEAVRQIKAAEAAAKGEVD